MLEKELIFERPLFFALNGSDSQLLDDFFYLYTYKWTWVIFYLCFLLSFIRRHNWREPVFMLLAVALLVLVCDQTSSHIFKPLFHRLRPTNHPDFKDIVDVFRYGDYEYRGSGYGFISGHATNSMGFAVFSALVFRNKFFSVSILLFALLMGYSRIYLGRHFISDVVVGWAVGAALGYGIYKLYQFGCNKLGEKNVQNNTSVVMKRNAYLLSAVFWLHVASLFLFHNQWIELRFLV